MFVSHFKYWNKATSENPDETAHKESSHLNLHCLQICVQIYMMSEFTRLYPSKIEPVALKSMYMLPVHCMCTHKIGKVQPINKHKEQKYDILAAA